MLTKTSTSVCRQRHLHQCVDKDIYISVDQVRVDEDIYIDVIDIYIGVSTKISTRCVDEDIYISVIDIYIGVSTKISTSVCRYLHQCRRYLHQCVDQDIYIGVSTKTDGEPISSSCSNAFKSTSVMGRITSIQSASSEAESGAESGAESAARELQGKAHTI